MNLASLYSLTLGQKIAKPYLNPIFYPLPFEKYIVIQAKTKESKNYDYWNEVIEFIKPELDKLGINLVSVGGAPEENLPNCYPTAGGTSFPQLQYLIQNSIAYLGADSISAHIAGAFDKKRIVLVSNNYANCVSPYFGSPENQIIIEPERQNGEKPSFSLVESPKSINTIRPERILRALKTLLDIPAPEIASLHFGDAYTSPTIEFVPNFPLNPQVAPNQVIHIRLDLLKDEIAPAHYQNILQVLSQRKCILYTNKSFNIELLKQVRPNILAFVYRMPAQDDIEFVKTVKRAGFPLRAICEYTTPANSLYGKIMADQIAELKFKYLDVAPIQFLEKKTLEMKFRENLYARSNRVIFSNNASYFSRAALEKNWMNQSNSTMIKSGEDLAELLKEPEYLYIFQKNESATN